MIQNLELRKKILIGNDSVKLEKNNVLILKYN